MSDYSISDRDGRETNIDVVTPVEDEKETSNVVEDSNLEPLLASVVDEAVEESSNEDEDFGQPPLLASALEEVVEESSHEFEDFGPRPLLASDVEEVAEESSNEDEDFGQQPPLASNVDGAEEIPDYTEKQDSEDAPLFSLLDEVKAALADTSTEVVVNTSTDIATAEQDVALVHEVAEGDLDNHLEANVNVSTDTVQEQEQLEGSGQFEHLNLALEELVPEKESFLPESVPGKKKKLQHAVTLLLVMQSFLTYTKSSSTQCSFGLASLCC
jgi:hypothetical protein